MKVENAVIPARAGDANPLLQTVKWKARSKVGALPQHLSRTGNVIEPDSNQCLLPKSTANCRAPID